MSNDSSDSDDSSKKVFLIRPNGTKNVKTKKVLKRKGTTDSLIINKEIKSKGTKIVKTKEAVKRKGTIDSFFVKKQKINNENLEEPINDSDTSEESIITKKRVNPLADLDVPKESIVRNKRANAIVDLGASDKVVGTNKYANQFDASEESVDTNKCVPPLLDLDDPEEIAGTNKNENQFDDMNISLPMVKKTKCVNPFDSSESESDSIYSEYDDNENSALDYTTILDFFNNSPFDILIQISGCSKVKSQKIIDRRPFSNITDLKSFKIISDAMIEGCGELLLIKENLVKLLKKCEGLSANLTKRIKAFITNNDLSSTSLDDVVYNQKGNLTIGLKLKSYQIVGINWLRILHEENLNGILADEMGLGKTIQTICFLSYLYDNNIKGPHLIIVPTSTLNNWERELTKWCPNLKVYVYHGDLNYRRQMRDEISYADDINILLTTYTISISNKDDRLFIKKLNFHYGIFDEAHMLKNMLSLRYQYINNFKTKRKLLLTGTPLQNNLIELISLLSFVMPGLFMKENDGLKKIFQMSQTSFNEDKIRQIKDMLAPFCLRRLKHQVLSQLPSKIVDIIFLPLCEEQSHLYKTYVEEVKQRNLSEENRIHPFVCVTEMRKISNHCLLVKNKYSDEILRKMSQDMLQDDDHITADKQLIFEDFSVMDDFEINNQCYTYPDAIGKYKLPKELLLTSNKVQYLDENLPIFLAKGDKVLIFSQFVMVLDILSEFLVYRDYRFLRLDGSTNVDDRQDYIDDFNDNEDVSIFLLTTRAGGIGINLTSANVVILYDIDYNPYNDRQAEDRCHRIGQLRDVRVIKLISKGTVDECILKIATEKLKLEQVTGTADIEEDQKSNSSDPKDIDFDAILNEVTYNV